MTTKELCTLEQDLFRENDKETDRDVVRTDIASIKSKLCVTELIQDY